MAQSTLWNLIDESEFLVVLKELGKHDEQAAELLSKAATLLQERLRLSGDQYSLPDDDYRGLCRVRNLVRAGLGWGPALQRNNIFKAANSLGMALPSWMF